jgi:choline-glycine betaine transporter
VKPEFKTISWFAMLFSGMGIDCFGVFQNQFIIFKSPMAEGGTAEAARKL